MNNDGFNCTKFFGGKSCCHRQNGKQLILNIIYIKKKNKGHDVKPCETQELTVLLLKKRPGCLTYCILLSGNEFNQLLAILWIP